MRITKIYDVIFSFLLICLVFSHSDGAVTYSGQSSPPKNKLVLWYRQAATNWMTSALPVGNGQLGAMVFGGADQEHLQFNEKTVWSGNKTTYGAYQNFGDLV